MSITAKAPARADPGRQAPDYWDFIYFVIGVTSQVSDVAVTSRLVAVHGAVSFILNATLLALTVNIAAGAI
jgi:uncharacterized membrane protein